MGHEGQESVWSAPEERPAPAPPVGPEGSGPAPWPPALAPPAPPRRTVRGAALALCIVVGLIGLGSCAALVVGTVRLARGPIRATDRYFAALERGDFATAYALECPALQVSADEAELRTRYSGDAVLSWHTHGFETSHDFGAGNRAGTGAGNGAGNGAVVTGTLATAREGARDITVELVQIDGDWLLCGALDVIG